MENDDFNAIPAQIKKWIPLQNKGKYSDTYSSLEIKELNNPDIAYKSIRHRLLDVNNWAHYATLTNAEFILLDNNGKNLEGLAAEGCFMKVRFSRLDRKSTRLNSSHVKISYAVFCLKKKKYK